MNAVRQRLSLALLFSILLHLVVIGGPGWAVPDLDDLWQVDEPRQIEARLAPPAVRTQTPTPRAAARSVRPHAAESPPAPPGTLALPPAGDSPQAALGQEGPEVPHDAPAPADVPGPGGIAPGGLPPTAIPVIPVAGVASAPTGLPRRGRILFSVTKGDQGFVIGQSLHQWNHDGSRYTLSNVTETTGLAALVRAVRVKWLSEGEIVQSGLRPHAFRVEKGGTVGDTASFDWAALKLLLSGGMQREVALIDGTQDMFSWFYQFSTQFPTLPSGHREIVVTTGRKLERYSLDVVGEERLHFRKVDWRTLHLRTNAGSQVIDVWLGLELRGLPVKIRFTDAKGESFDQIVEEIEIEDKTDSTGTQ